MFGNSFGKVTNFLDKKETFPDFFTNFANNMKKLVIFCAFLVIFTACQESLEDRCAREAKTYTEKHCPVKVAPDIIFDSMAFDKSSHIISYAYTVSGVLDDAEVINRNMPRERLLMEVKNSPHLQLYKEAGYSFRYIYYSAKNKGTQLFEATFHQSDYQ